MRIEDAIPPLDPAPSAPVPHLMATLRFGESVELGVMGLPVVGRFAPLWALTLPLAGRRRSTRFDRLPRVRCGVRGRGGSGSCMPLALLGEVEEGDPSQVAALLRITLETAAGN